MPRLLYIYFQQCKYTRGRICVLKGLRGSVKRNAAATGNVSTQLPETIFEPAFKFAPRGLSRDRSWSGCRLEVLGFFYSSSVQEGYGRWKQKICLCKANRIYHVFFAQTRLDFYQSLDKSLFLLCTHSCHAEYLIASVETCVGRSVASPQECSFVGFCVCVNMRDVACG